MFRPHVANGTLATVTVVRGTFATSPESSQCREGHLRDSERGPDPHYSHGFSAAAVRVTAGQSGSDSSRAYFFVQPNSWLRRL